MPNHSVSEVKRKKKNLFIFEKKEKKIREKWKTKTERRLVRAAEGVIGLALV